MGSLQPQPTGYPVYPPPDLHVMEPHFNPPPPPYLGPPQGVLPTNNQLQQSSAGFQPPQQARGFQAPSLHPQPSTYYHSSEQQAKKTTSPVKQNPNSASSNQIHTHITKNRPLSRSASPPQSNRRRRFPSPCSLLPTPMSCWLLPTPMPGKLLLTPIPGRLHTAPIHAIEVCGGSCFHRLSTPVTQPMPLPDVYN